MQHLLDYNDRPDLTHEDKEMLIEDLVHILLLSTLGAICPASSDHFVFVCFFVRFSMFLPMNSVGSLPCGINGVFLIYYFDLCAVLR